MTIERNVELRKIATATLDRAGTALADLQPTSLEAYHFWGALRDKAAGYAADIGMTILASDCVPEIVPMDDKEAAAFANSSVTFQKYPLHKLYWIEANDPDYLHWWANEGPEGKFRNDLNRYLARSKYKQ